MKVSPSFLHKKERALRCRTSGRCKATTLSLKVVKKIIDEHRFCENGSVLPKFSKTQSDIKFYMTMSLAIVPISKSNNERIYLESEVVNNKFYSIKTLKSCSTELLAKTPGFNSTLLNNTKSIRMENIFTMLFKKPLAYIKYSAAALINLPHISKSLDSLLPLFEI
uniref:Uncharacterized protein n=1 Tax=Glossina pallidipes TaxID=7398 RepID=A0A1A9ZCT0_GLOPL